METLFAYIDEEQAGDLGELYDGWNEESSVIKEGMKLGVQLSIYCDNKVPEISVPATSDEFEEAFEQPNGMSPKTIFSGRILTSESSYMEPNKFVPTGRTHLQILILAREIPVVIDYSWEGKKNTVIPNGNAYIKGEGDLHCDVAFFGSSCFSPVSSEIIKVKVFPEADRPELVWGMVELRLRTEISEFDIFVDNLDIESKSIAVSEYSPLVKTMKKYQSKLSRNKGIRSGRRYHWSIGLVFGAAMFIIGLSLFISTVHLTRVWILSSLGVVIICYFMVLFGILLIGNSLLSALNKWRKKTE